jgi:hypothetical protein
MRRSGLRFDRNSPRVSKQMRAFSNFGPIGLVRPLSGTKIGRKFAIGVLERSNCCPLVYLQKLVSARLFFLHEISFRNRAQLSSPSPIVEKSGLPIDS